MKKNIYSKSSFQSIKSSGSQSPTNFILIVYLFTISCLCLVKSSYSFNSALKSINIGTENSFSNKISIIEQKKSFLDDNNKETQKEAKLFYSNNNSNDKKNTKNRSVLVETFTDEGIANPKISIGKGFERKKLLLENTFENSNTFDDSNCSINNCIHGVCYQNSCFCENNFIGELCDKQIGKLKVTPVFLCLCLITVAVSSLAGFYFSKLFFKILNCCGPKTNGNYSSASRNITEESETHHVFEVTAKKVEE